MSEADLRSLLIPAVGGQGGGVLSEWVVEAALADGYPVHGTSIPGVAQRTGSTTYYVELSTDPALGEPAFSLYPVPGALDVLLAPELLEVGRAIELGFVSPQRTVVVCSTHRLYSIAEKMATGRSIYPAAELEAAARAAARLLVAFDALAVAREQGTEVNAVLLGALAGSGALPVRPEAYRAAIERKGVQVAANLRGFEVGFGIGRDAVAGGSPAGAPPAVPAPSIAVPPGFADDVAALPEPLRPTVSAALARLIDYQDPAYARRYLDGLRPFVAARTPDRLELAGLVARHLAVWLTYEDAVRVAQLKIRPARFARIGREARAPAGAEIVVTDYLKPDLDELYGVLPYRLVAPFARWAERRWPRGRPALGQHVKSTTVTGYLRLRLLTLLRPLRPISYRAHEEHGRIERWLAAVRLGAERDVALACEVARAAQLVKGYGDVRRRLTAVFDGLLGSVLRAVELGERAGGDLGAARGLAARYRALVLSGPEGEVEAARLAATVLARLEAGDRAGAMDALQG